jgi:hypothetical protein
MKWFTRIAIAIMVAVILTSSSYMVLFRFSDPTPSSDTIWTTLGDLIFAPGVFVALFNPRGSIHSGIDYFSHFAFVANVLFYSALVSFILWLIDRRRR